MTKDLLDLMPGISLGPFELGNTLFNTLNFLRSYKFNYPSVKLAWDEQIPSLSPIHLILSTPPLALQFDPLSQRLKRIELLNDPLLWIRYRGKPLFNGNTSNSGGKLATTSRGESGGREGGGGGEEVIRSIRRVMGPTYSTSKSSSIEGEEILSYPGVVFGIKEESSSTSKSLEAEDKNVFSSTTSSNGGDSIISTVSTRLILFPLSASTSNSTSTISIEKLWLNPILPESPRIARGDLRLVQIQYLTTTTITKLDESLKPISTILHFHSGSDSDSDPSVSPTSLSSVSTPSSIKLELGKTTYEDILCQLGSPIRLFWKEDDRMTIHTQSLSSPSFTPLSPPSISSSPSFSSKNTSSAINNISLLTPSDYFISYPHLGLTFLIYSSLTHDYQNTLEEGKRKENLKHVVGKIILHCNLPGEINFGRTSRVRFEFDLIDTNSTEILNLSSNGGKQEGGRKRLGGSESKGSKLGDILSSSSSRNGSRERERERPMELDREVDSNSTHSLGSKGEWGKMTEIHGFPGIALEVTQTDDIETVWIF